MPKRATAIDDIIDDAVDKKLNKKLENLTVTDSDDEELRELEELNHQRQFELDKATATLLDSLHYVKLYRLDILNPKHPLFLEIIYDLDSIDDFEYYIQKLAYEKGWPSGKYKLAFFLKDPKSKMEAKVRHQAEFNVNVPKNNIMDSANQIADNKSKETDALAAVEKSAQLIKTVRDAIGASQNNYSDPKAIAETFKMGIDTLKETLPKQQQTDLAETLIKLLPFIKEILQKPKEPSFLEQLAALKQSGLFPEQKESSSPMVEKIIEAALNKLINGESSAPSPSIGVELVKQIAPQIPNMIERITGTINNVVSYQSGRPTVRKQEPPQLSQMSIPLFDELFVAIENDDYKFFSKLSYGIGYYLDNGEQYLAAILQGQVDVDTTMMMLTQYGGEKFNTEKAKNYISKFFDWYQSLNAAVTEEIHKNKGTLEIEMIVGKCEKCGIEYEYENLEDLKQDTCDNIVEDNKVCGGMIAKLSEHSEKIEEPVEKDERKPETFNNHDLSKM